MNDLSLAVWLHVMAGIVWIGLLYYFNFVQVPGMGKAKADGTAAGIAKHIAPRALLWFRWGAVATWITGVGALQKTTGIVEAFTFANEQASIIGVGAWLGTIMLLNVWGLIWPNQKKVLGMVEATDAEKAKAGRIALLASRTNTALSIPMLMSMVAYGHGGFPI